MKIARGFFVKMQGRIARSCITAANSSNSHAPYCNDPAAGVLVPHQAPRLVQRVPLGPACGSIRFSYLIAGDRFFRIRAEDHFRKPLRHKRIRHGVRDQNVEIRLSYRRPAFVVRLQDSRLRLVKQYGPEE